LITAQHVLSAAHCYKDEDINSQLFVVLGSNQPLKEGIKEEKRRKNAKRVITHINEIETVIIHSMYQEPAAYFDVSIAKLKEKVKISGKSSKFIFPICCQGFRKLLKNMKNDMVKHL